MSKLMDVCGLVDYNTKTRDFISSLTGQSKTEIHRELESYNKEREHL